MHRIDTSGATVDNKFKASPAPATQIGPDWMNAVQEELAKLVEDPTGGSTALVKANNGQVLAAVLAMIGREATARTAAITAAINALAERRQVGVYSGLLTAPTTLMITFPVAFPSGSVLSIVATEINATASASRDNWVQIMSYDETGFTVVVQGSATGGSQSIDGFHWHAELV
ncbi:gp53-like domain-containing protein [Sphingomonas hengshuiensis]|uniref:Putative tail fiber protein gp53-like C-terminal domain-containing protein n=1 Tax=Sphingomonas hengshuiensis TaxID=1609977 RepID=A0A7U4JAD5_9SPHN|nr:hypothetical protein [Sphingomonas hengshuiensis]AJP73174.1 hypothetical protein TS85_17335 [Sphingomonas hengshuiensis]